MRMYPTSLLSRVLALCVLPFGVSVASAPALADGLPSLTLRSALASQSDDDDDDIDDIEEEDADLEDEGEAEVGDPTEGGIKYGGEEVGESIGGATGFTYGHGFYMTSELGGNIRFGGYGDPSDSTCLRCESKIVSNLQPWIGLAVGYDFLPWLGAQMSFGTGFIADAAPIEQDRDSPENMAITMVNAAVTGNFYLPYPVDRLALHGKAFVGAAILTPRPTPGGAPWGVSFGATGGIRYATLLTGVHVGLDLTVYGVFNPSVKTGQLGGAPLIPGFSFAPVIKYVF